MSERLLHDFDFPWRVNPSTGSDKSLVRPKTSGRRRTPTTETAISLLTHIREVHKLPLAQAYDVIELGQGGFNIAFKLTAGRHHGKPEALEHEPDQLETDSSGTDAPPKTLVLRLRLGVNDDPFYKLESEVASMTFARREAGLPVPRVFYFDSSADNAHGLEWMIMEFIDGRDATVLRSADGTLSGANESMTHRNAGRFAAAVTRHTLRLQRAASFEAVGALYCDWEARVYFIGPLVGYGFSACLRREYSLISRGPFVDLRSYFEARLDLIMAEARDPEVHNLAFRDFRSALDARLADKDLAERRRKLIELVFIVKLDLLPRLVDRACGLEGETGVVGPVGRLATTMQHPDLHDQNILLDRASGDIIAVLDWEGAKFMPRGMLPPLPEVATRLGHSGEEGVKVGMGGEKWRAVALGRLLRGETGARMEGNLFRAPEECEAIQGLVLRALDLVLGEVRFMDREHVAWLVEGVEALKSLEDEPLTKNAPEVINSKQTVREAIDLWA